MSGAHGEEDAILLTMMDKENVEAMAQDVVECISNAKFGEAYILACRGGSGGSSMLLMTSSFSVHSLL